MGTVNELGEFKDHCRIGSSENLQAFTAFIRADHCRIGSSEMHLARQIDPDSDHCRIGSSEM